MATTIYNKNGIFEAIDNVADVVLETVCSTIGPDGKTCILHDGGVPKVTKDGVTVAEFLNFESPEEEAIYQLIKESSRKTGELVGDGTTTSMYLTVQLLKLFIENKDFTLKELQDEVKSILIHLESVTMDLKSLPLQERLAIIDSIASISSNNDSEVVELLNNIMVKLGTDAVMDLKINPAEETYVEFQEGMLIEAPVAVTSKHYLDKPGVVLVSDKISKPHEIKSLLVVASVLFNSTPSTHLIVIAKEFSDEVKNYVNVNNRRQKTSVILSEHDGIGTTTYELLDDMALLLNCKIHSVNQSSNFNVKDVTLDDVVFMDSAVVTPNTTLIRRKGMSSLESESNKLVIKERIASARKKGESHVGEIRQLEKRLAKYSSTATIYVGGFTDAEKSEKNDRIEDAMMAVESALNHGVVPGAGYALFTAASKVNTDLMKSWCKSPFHLLTNDISDKSSLEKVNKDNYIYNVKTGKIGNAIELGVLDPAEVLKKAVRQAESIAKTLLGSSSVIVRGDFTNG